MSTTCDAKLTPQNISQVQQLLRSHDRDKNGLITTSNGRFGIYADTQNNYVSLSHWDLNPYTYTAYTFKRSQDSKDAAFHLTKISAYTPVFTNSDSKYPSGQTETPLDLDKHCDSAKGVIQKVFNQGSWLPETPRSQWK
jgi:hypothetical protein